MFAAETDIPTEPREGETLDYLPGGGLKLLQKRDGYRFSIPSLILADFVRTNSEAKVADLGTGCGVLALLMARRAEVTRVAGIEIQQELADLASRNVIINDLARKVDIYLADIRHHAELFAAACFDVVVSNPPYFPVGSGRLNPRLQKALARHEITMTLADCLAAASHLLPLLGKVNIVYPARRQTELISQMLEQRFLPTRLLMVHSRPGGVGEFVVVEAKKEGRGEGGELEMLPPLFIWKMAGGYTDAMEKLFERLSMRIFPLDGMGRGVDG